MTQDQHLIQEDAAAQRRVDEADYLARNTRPICILKMLASDPNLSLDMARALSMTHEKAQQGRFE